MGVVNKRLHKLALFVRLGLGLITPRLYTRVHARKITQCDLSRQFRDTIRDTKFHDSR